MNKFSTKMWTIDCKIERSSDCSYVVYSMAKGDTLAEAQATARLIAAAPEMYDLLEDFMLACSCSACSCDERNKAVEAAHKLLLRIETEAEK